MLAQDGFQGVIYGTMIFVAKGASRNKRCACATDFQGQLSENSAIL